MSDKPTTDRATLFYQNDPSLKTELGFTISDIIYGEYGDCKFLEGCHNYIQWAFPSNEMSRYNSNAPLITTETVEQFENNPYLVNRLNSMIDIFYMFLCKTQLDWITPRNHNFLRITRMLKCVNILLGRDAAEKLYGEIISLTWDVDNAIIGDAENYWKEAAFGKHTVE